MATTVGKWKTLGTNTAGGTSAGVDPTLVGSTGQQTAHVRHEVEIWQHEDTAFRTPHFNWPVFSDFTIVLDPTVIEKAADIGDVDVKVVGSVDGTNYIELKDINNWDGGGGAQTDAGGVAIYDMDANGRMPFMAVELTCADVDNRTTPFKVVIVSH